VTRSPRRIVVTGPESTGKTTLAAALAQSLSVPWVPEAARVHAEAQLALGRALDATDVETIARLHIANEDAARGRAGAAQAIVLDTDLISTVVYARHYYGECPAWIEAAARERLGDRYLLCLPDLPWTADGVRDRPESRGEMLAAFRATLAEFGARVEVVGGTGVARLERARAIVAAAGL